MESARTPRAMKVNIFLAGISFDIMLPMSKLLSMFYLWIQVALCRKLGSLRFLNFHSSSPPMRIVGVPESG